MRTEGYSRRIPFLIYFMLGVSVAGPAQRSNSVPPDKDDVMVAAVSRDGCMFCGGIGPGRGTEPGTVVVEQMGYLTQSGQWRILPCGKNAPKTCPKFAREYLSKPHNYIVVSANGQGTAIQAAPTKLSECRDYSGPGTYSGAALANSAIAASSADLFSESEPLRPLSNQDSESIRKALGRLVPQKLDSARWLKVFSLHMQGQDLFIAQRVYTDIAAHTDARYDFVFAIGTRDQGRFRLRRWKVNTEDEEERILGTIRLKTGRDFLITTVNDPESQWFRVYGMRDGKLTLVFEGGGSSC